MKDKRCQYIDRQEASRFFLSLPAMGWKGLRDRTAYQTMYYSGLRVAELCALYRHNLRFKDNYIQVVEGKGGKDRNVPLCPKLLDILTHWLDCRPYVPEAPLFPSGTGKPLTSQHLWQKMKKYGLRAGLSREQAHPHALRHSFAANAVRGGADIGSVMETLGHSDLATTRRYLGGLSLTAVSDVAKAIEKVA